ncbi:hypothetical protein ABPG74_022466 [Tetrahymena malaccensis]
MRLRKVRAHETGSSNLDYKAEQIERPDVPRIEFLSTAKSKSFSDLIKMKINKIAPQPVKETETFYVENQVQEKHKFPIGYPRFGQLEEPELRKRVFTGDSNTQYDIKLLPRVKKQYTKIDKKEQRDKLIATKHDQHATAIAETQLVGLEQYNKQTLEGKVDLDKVKEIRRAIRRRYANRKNFQKIFNAWDDNCTGAIDPKNAFDMIKSMGININFDEARVLIASADIDKSGDLSLNEFMDLIFNNNDILNVNLKELPVMTEDEYSSLQTANKVMNKLRDDAKLSKQTRHHNQLNVILKNKLSSLKTYIFAADSLQQGFVSHEKFFEIVKKLAIPESIMSQEDIQFVFNRHKIDEHKFNYREFVDFLRDFTFVPEDIYVDPAENEKKKSEKQKFLTAYNYEEDNKINIFDSNSVNSWHLECIREKARRVFRIIERYLDSKESFDSFLMQQMKINNVEEFKTKQISKQSLTKAIENLFLNVGDKEVKKDEVESFLSIFSYNNHDHTEAAKISRAIYEEEDGEWFKRMQWKLKRPPPPPQKLYPEANKNEEQEGLGWNDENTEFHQVEPNEQNYEKFYDTKYKPSDMDMKQYKGLTRTSSAPHYPSSLNRILSKFENRIFCGSQKAYEIFKKFDADQDGYISQKDMAHKLKEMNILDEHEIKPFLIYLDPTNKGFVDFTEFSSRVRNGMTNNDNMGQQVVVPFTVPCADHLKDTQKMLPFIQKRINDLRKPYYPPEQTQKITRYGATPHFQNTFSNFKVLNTSPMFATASERFMQNHNHRTQFQKEEFQKKKQYEEGRIQRKRENMMAIQQKIDHEVIVSDIKDDNKRKTKGLAQWTYEHRAHLQNNYK